MSQHKGIISEIKNTLLKQSINKNKTDNNINDLLIPNTNNNPIIQEVNELLTDQEQIKKKVLNYNKDFIELELSIPESLTQSKFPIKFLLKIPMEFPKEEPEVYCITKFSYPHIYDGRNLLDAVLKKKFEKDIHNLDIIINRIPRFIIEFNNSLEEGYLLLVGKYMINNIYSLDKIKELPIFHQNVKQNEKNKKKLIKKNKILTISDLSFCLYEIESKHFAKLTFQANLNDLVSIKRNTQENTITFIWKDINKENENIQIEILTDETEKIKSTLLEKMELFGKEYNVSQKVIKKRMGKLPCNNIEHVEKQIQKIEKDFNDDKNVNMDLVHKLMTLYQTAVEYYSAINSPEFQAYTDKIKNLMGTKQINELIDKTKDQNKTTSTNDESIKPHKEKQNEKEEKILTQGLNKIKNTLSSLSGKKETKKEQKKVAKPKVSISKEDEDGGTLDVGSDDDEEDEEEEDEKEEKKNEDLKEEDKIEENKEVIQKSEENKEGDKKEEKENEKKEGDNIEENKNEESKEEDKKEEKENDNKE